MERKKELWLILGWVLLFVLIPLRTVTSPFGPDGNATVPLPAIVFLFSFWSPFGMMSFNYYVPPFCIAYAFLGIALVAGIVAIVLYCRKKRNGMLISLIVAAAGQLIFLALNEASWGWVSPPAYWTHPILWTLWMIAAFAASAAVLILAAIRLGKRKKEQ